VLPSPVTFGALYNLLVALDDGTEPDITIPRMRPFLVRYANFCAAEYFQTVEYRLLAGWFNSLFLYPGNAATKMSVLTALGLVLADLGFIRPPNGGTD
jgi:hypothetical protein